SINSAARPVSSACSDSSLCDVAPNRAGRQASVASAMRRTAASCARSASADKGAGGSPASAKNSPQAIARSDSPFAPTAPAGERQLVAKGRELLRLRAHRGLECFRLHAAQEKSGIEQHALADLARRRRAPARFVGLPRQLFEECVGPLACVLQQLARGVLFFL